MKRLLLSLLLAALAACGDAAADAASTVRDSAGVRIVESTMPAWAEGQGWAVSPEPATEIGEMDGEAPYQLDRVAGVLRLSDGRIVVANGGSRELRWFGADGRFLRAAGGEGGGPGEFRSLSWIGAGRGDSVLAWNGPERRLSVFAADGAFGRSVQPEGLRILPEAVGALADGSLVVTEGINFAAFRDAAEGAFRDSVTYRRVGAHGDTAQPVGRFPGPERFLVRHDGNSSNERIVFGRDVVVRAAGDGLLVGDNDRYEIARRTPDGRTTMLIRRRHTPVAVGPDDVARVHAEEDARAAASRAPRTPADDALQRRVRERLPHRPTLPAFDTLLPDAEGNLWVRRFRRPGDPSRWDIFGAEGRWLGTVETPAGLDVRQVGADYVLGVWKDEVDVEHVRLHRLRKPATP